jgi:hypothetical protein
MTVEREERREGWELAGGGLGFPPPGGAQEERGRGEEGEFSCFKIFLSSSCCFPAFSLDE